MGKEKIGRVSISHRHTLAPQGMEKLEAYNLHTHSYLCTYKRVQNICVWPLVFFRGGAPRGKKGVFELEKLFPVGNTGMVLIELLNFKLYAIVLHKSSKGEVEKSIRTL